MSEAIWNNRNDRVRVAHYRVRGRSRRRNLLPGETAQTIRDSMKPEDQFKLYAIYRCFFWQAMKIDGFIPIPLQTRMRTE